MSIEKELQALLEEDDTSPGSEASQEVSGMPKIMNLKQGDMPPGDLEALKPICFTAEQKYQEVMTHIKTIRSANQMLTKFHSKGGGVTEQDVERAKKEFHQAKESYMEIGTQMNEGIKKIYEAAKTYFEDLLVQDLYITYLAKLLGSLEARNPVENLVKRMASYMFSFDREQIYLTEEEERRGLTIESKKKEMLEQKDMDVRRLESRYQKRQLQIRLKAGERKLVIIKNLMRLTKMDPEDIHTHIWLATLMSEELGKIRDQNRRLEMRDDILQHCQKAFTGIDDFLNLQGIQSLSERDKRRSEYLKTITGIRKPLVHG
ncbi:MAG: hypothetical protein OEZ59_06965 [Deltaproteobacteria bacterium]|nr:hypothetical protein [Deltaproteobacteria bacterium]